ncbi:probable LRR receptor-like serine/threonine-protein kinase IRK [Gossypium hirsutum]|uniref:Probable LRR receptor-like serine/threonine-protein kinase IRK n=1 Tax=Gossypium hirsutum TaxID=3635 RepID=A0ABM3ABV9_GOSHI|nr:probable LRR receptor-like serine/threonine-protein kinase IRK [Gossypium hirsutum]
MPTHNHLSVHYYLNENTELKVNELSLQGASLHFLYVIEPDHNNLTGNLPQGIYRGGSLEYFTAADSQLTGQSLKVPSNCGLCRRLQSLSIARNNLRGTIPAEIGNSRQIHRLDLSSNHLVGEILKKISKLTSLLYLYLNGNKLSGSVPLELGLMLAIFSPFVLLEIFIFSSEHLLLMKSLTLLAPLLLCVTLLCSSLNVASDSAAEALAILKWKASLQSQNHSVLLSWNTSNNPNTKTSPCAWFGIHCNHADSVTKINLTGYGVKELDLSTNELYGIIPPQISQLSKLTYLDLSFNQFSGKIPPEISHLVHLQTLHLAGNQLNGSIPREIGQLKFLTDLA